MLINDTSPTVFSSSIMATMALLALSSDSRWTTIIGVIIMGMTIALLISLALDYSHKHSGNEPGEYFWTSDKHPEV